MTLTVKEQLSLALEIMSDRDVDKYAEIADNAESNTDSDRLSIALEILSDRDIEKFQAVVKIAETDNIDIYEAAIKYEK